MEEAHLQKQRFGIRQGGLNGASRGEFQAIGGLALEPPFPILAEGPEEVEHHGNRMGQVEGGVGGSGRDVKEATGLEKLVIGQPPILPTKHQGSGANRGGTSGRRIPGGQEPGQGRPGRAQRERRPL
jgi:hypothetical protein